MPISADVKLGQRVKIPRPDLVNLYGCSIGDDTKIGTFVELQKRAAIGLVQIGRLTAMLEERRAQAAI